MNPSPQLPAFGDLAVLDDRRQLDPEAMVEADRTLGESVGLGLSPPTYRIWENARALVVTAKDARLPNAAGAAEDSAERGWPVVVRDSGGGAVPHGPGILQMSLLLPMDRLQRPALEALYEALCSPVRIALDTLGVETTYGDVPGSFCDGRFNLVANGKKIAGTSQRWRGGLPPGSRPGSYALAHMILFIEADMVQATEAVNRYYEQAGGRERYDPTSVETVRSSLAGSVEAGLTERVRSAIGKALSETAL